MLVRGTNIESEKTLDSRGIPRFRDTVWNGTSRMIINLINLNLESISSDRIYNSYGITNDDVDWKLLILYLLYKPLADMVLIGLRWPKTYGDTTMALNMIDASININKLIFHFWFHLLKICCYHGYIHFIFCGCYWIGVWGKLTGALAWICIKWGVSFLL